MKRLKKLQFSPGPWHSEPGSDLIRDASGDVVAAVFPQKNRQIFESNKAILALALDSYEKLRRVIDVIEGRDEA